MNMKNNIKIVNLNKYTRPEPTALISQTNRYITNGTDNAYFYYVEDLYISSPTSQAIIDNVTNYILGAGLKTNGYDISNILSSEDLRCAVQDFKTYGSCVLQVVYTFANDKRVGKLYYLPTKTIAIAKQDDLSAEIEGYYYSFDWRNKSKFRPQFIPAFGFGQNNETEILRIQRQSPQPLFALSDWVSGNQWAEVEGEISNFCINHIQNNFSAGKIVNINKGSVGLTEDDLYETRQGIIADLTGSGNAGRVIVSFNENNTETTTVEDIQIIDAYQQFETLTKEAESKLLLAHKITSPTIVGLDKSTGFSSNAEELDMALKVFYRSQINPFREILTAGLEQVLKLNDPNIELHFEDFEQFNVKEDYNVNDVISIIEKYNGGVLNYNMAVMLLAKSMNISIDEAKVLIDPIQPAPVADDTVVEENLAIQKVSFDYDNILTTKEGVDRLEEYMTRGNVDVYIISARQDIGPLMAFATKHRIPRNNVFATGSNLAKINKIKELGIDLHFDNNMVDVVSKLPNIGRQLIKS
jgi:hypothetical protein